MNFSIGDWVTNSLSHLFQVTEDNIYASADFVLWSPKQSEWAWFYDIEYPMYYVLSKFVERDKDGYWCHLHYSDVLACFEHCEPFTNSLPSFIKDK